MPSNPELDELQRQLDEATSRLSELETQNATLANQARTATFATLGLDPAKGVGKLIADRYEGDLTPDAVKAWASEYEIPLAASDAPGAGPGASPPPTPPHQTPADLLRAAQQQHLEALRGGAAAATGGDPVSVEQFNHLERSNPSRARELLLSGNVSMRPETRAFLEAKHAAMASGNGQ